MSKSTSPTTSNKNPSSSKPIHANFASEKLTTGAGVAIFHLASQRVVVCRHGRDGYWFLPKGRRNVGEVGGNGGAAVREGFEESGYRNRLLPLPIPHRQPPPDDLAEDDIGNVFVTEPLWTQLLPQSSTAQYILHWYAAETVPRDIEEELSATAAASTGKYISPPPFPRDMKIAERIAMDFVGDGPERKAYEPLKHIGTGVDEEEALYESYLLPIAEARKKLNGTIMADVVRRSWEAIELRMRIEQGNV